MRLRTDYSNWEPLAVQEVSSIFSGMSIDWGIAGGWALDIHLGRKTRNHSDIDIVVFRADQQVIYQRLKNDWTLYKAKDGKLSLWSADEYLDAVNSVWVSRDSQSPWAFEIMFMDNEQDNWVYRREKTVQEARVELFSTDENNVPYLNPAVQLLYKGGVEQIREKDSQDFLSVLPTLSIKEKTWLKESLKRQFSMGHSWIPHLE
ncbi:nucleotidyltransferase domain-containing protein [Planomicrobium sp. MB-3u-38]|uniref:nucleotidyltransferase domain-containing protein n=1 Tax=Planomicrobium sp. MB-3u-38 TaxID=2058318 RepID=UPI001E2DC148|nr:hypothetical protein [Planomicrobium sp. MB-3u-38]